MTQEKKPSLHSLYERTLYTDKDTKSSLKEFIKDSEYGIYCKFLKLTKTSKSIDLIKISVVEEEDNKFKCIISKSSDPKKDASEVLNKVMEKNELVKTLKKDYEVLTKSLIDYLSKERLNFKKLLKDPTKLTKRPESSSQVKKKSKI